MSDDIRIKAKLDTSGIDSGIDRAQGRLSSFWSTIMDGFKGVGQAVSAAFGDMFKGVDTKALSTGLDDAADKAKSVAKELEGVAAVQVSKGVEQTGREVAELGKAISGVKSSAESAMTGVKNLGSGAVSEIAREAKTASDAVTELAERAQSIKKPSLKGKDLDEYISAINNVNKGIRSSESASHPSVLANGGGSVTVKVVADTAEATGEIEQLSAAVEKVVVPVEADTTPIKDGVAAAASEIEPIEVKAVGIDTSSMDPSQIVAMRDIIGDVWDAVVDKTNGANVKISEVVDSAISKFNALGTEYNTKLQFASKMQEISSVANSMENLSTTARDVLGEGVKFDKIVTAANNAISEIRSTEGQASLSAHTALDVAGREIEEMSRVAGEALQKVKDKKASLVSEGGGDALFTDAAVSKLSELEQRLESFAAKVNAAKESIQGAFGSDDPTVSSAPSVEPVGIDELPGKIADAVKAGWSDQSIGDVAKASASAFAESSIEPIRQRFNSLKQQLAANGGVMTKELADGFKSVARDMGVVSTQATQMGERIERATQYSEKIAPAGLSRSLDEASKSFKSMGDDAQQVKAEASALGGELDQQPEKVARFRTQVMQAKQEMMQMRAAGMENSEQYAQLRDRAIELQRVMMKTNKEVSILASPGTTFQGLLAGMRGVAGAFSAAQGAAALFGEKNKDLQKTMVRLQAAMSIVQGLQALNNATLATGAFRVGILGRLETWWAECKATAAAATTADTAAEGANTVAKGANTAATAALSSATTAGTAANTVHAFSWRAVGVAMKSVPILGWIAALVSLVGAIYGVIKALGGVTDEEKNMAKVMEAASSDLARQKVHFDLLYKAANDANRPIQERIALGQRLRNEMPGWRRETDALAIATGRAADEYLRLAQNIEKSIMAKAGEKVAIDAMAERIKVQNDESHIKDYNFVTNKQNRDRYNKIKKSMPADIRELLVRKEQKRGLSMVDNGKLNDWLNSQARNKFSPITYGDVDFMHDYAKRYYDINYEGDLGKNKKEIEAGVKVMRDNATYTISEEEMARTGYKPAGMSDYDFNRIAAEELQKKGKGLKKGQKFTFGGETYTKEQAQEKAKKLQREIQKEDDGWSGKADDRNAKAGMRAAAKADRQENQEIAAENKLTEAQAKAAETQLKNRKAHAAAMMEIAERSQQALIDLETDGATKRLAQTRLNNAKELREIERKMRDEINAEVERQKKAHEQRESIAKARNKKYKVKSFDSGVFPYTEFAVGSKINKDAMSAEEIGMVNTDELNEILAAYSDLYDSVSKRHKLAEKEIRKTQQQAMDEYVKEYGDTEEKIAAIHRIANRKLEDESTMAGRAKIRAEERSAIAELKYQQFTTEVAPQAFGDLAKLSKETVKSLITELENHKAEVYESFDPERIKAYEKALDDLRAKYGELEDNELSFRNMFTPEYFRQQKRDKTQEDEYKTNATNDEAAAATARGYQESTEARAIGAMRSLGFNYTTDNLYDGSSMEAAADILRGQLADAKENIEKGINVEENKATVDALERNIETIYRLIDALNAARAATVSAEKTAKDSNDTYEKKKEENKQKYNSKEQGKTIGQEVGKYARLTGDLAEGTGGILSQFGIGGEAGSDANNALTAISGLSNAAAGAAGAYASFMSGDMAGALKNAMGAVSSMVSMATSLNDNAKEAEIKRLEEEKERLVKENERLERLSQKQYSKAKSLTYGEEIKNMEAQQEALRKQIDAEKDKKKSDKDRIKEWQDQIESLSVQIEEYKEKALDAIIGEDIATSIGNFADMLASSWDSAWEKARETKKFVRQLLKSMVLEAMKSDISGPIEDLRARTIAAMADGIVTDAEKKAIEDYANSIANDITQRYGWADEFLDDGSYDSASSDRGFATASQESIDELNGRFSALHTSSEMSRQTLCGIYLDTSAIKIGLANQARREEENQFLAAAAITHLEEIAKNTRWLIDIHDKLTSIETNTKELC